MRLSCNVWKMIGIWNDTGEIFHELAEFLNCIQAYPAGICGSWGIVLEQCLLQKFTSIHQSVWYFFPTGTLFNI